MGEVGSQARVRAHEVDAMSIGIHEIIFLMAVSALTGAGFIYTKCRATWLWGIPICVAVATAITPPDVGSTFVVAAPFSVLYTYLVAKRVRQAGETERTS
jgi:Sec-independent protein secretion pathway component TatC